jgi:transglutaminase-like putative cysteine protease
VRLPIASGVATAAVMTTLYPLFSGGGWFWSGLGAILVVTAVGVLATRHSIAPWLTPVAQFAALWVFFTMVFTGEQAWARVVPTKESVLALADLAAEGFADIQRYAVPVAASPGITLITASGVGLIAVLVDLLAARLRRAALAGLPLLTLFVVPAEIVPDPIGWPAFLIGALGFTSLLMADGRERVGQWGRAVLVRRAAAGSAAGSATTRAAAGPVGGSVTDADPNRLRLSGRRIGFAAIAVAILVPAVLPTLQPNPLFGFGVGSGTGRGGNTISIPNPIVGLKGQLSLPQNSTVLVYSSSDDVPRYLRIFSLDVFTGDQWTMTSPTGRPQDRVDNGPLPKAPGLAANVPVKQAESRIRISGNIDELRFLPLPYPAATVRADGDWRADRDTLMVFSTRDYAGGLEYDVVSAHPEPTREMLRDAGDPPEEIMERYLQLPPDVPAQVRELAVRETRGARTAYEKAVRLQQWFRGDGRFTYSLTTQGHDNSALVDFLINTRTGYCEQFAASMAVMARLLGIPARVSIGYTGGTRFDDTWQVRTHDSHAWPELYFEGVGWLAFEPTPGGIAGQGTARTPEYSLPPQQDGTPDGRTDSPSTQEEGADPTGAATDDDRALRDPDAQQQAGSGTGEADDAGLPLAAKVGLGVIVLLLIAGIPALARSAQRARRRTVIARAYADHMAAVAAGGPPGVTGATRSGPGGAARAGEAAGAAVVAAWSELDDVLRDHGVSREPSESPRTLARRLTERFEFDSETSASIGRIATAAERLMFAPAPGDIGPLTDDTRRVRRALTAAMPRGQRIRAMLLPPSMLLRLRRMGERVLDGFDRLEGLRLRGGS